MTVRYGGLAGVLALALAACGANIGDTGADDRGVDGGGEPAGGPDANGPVGGDTADAGQEPPEPVRFEPSNIDGALVELGTETLVFGADDSPYVIDTDSGVVLNRLGVDVRPAGVVFTVVPQTLGAPALGVFSTTRLEVEQGAEVYVRGASALVLAVSGNAVIEGEILNIGGVGSPEIPGAGGFRGGIAESVNGAGPGGGAGRAVDFDVGGGGAGHVALGGNGGGRQADPGSAPGVVYGSQALVPLVGGSGGGAGGGDGGNGRGGGGGGAVQLTSFGAVIIGPEGGINCGGGGGEGGKGDDGGGGGGSGGAVLIEAPQVVVLGVLATNGGGGGAGAEKAAGDGADGLPGVLGATSASGGAGSEFGTSGGGGGASGAAQGQPGTPARETADDPTDNAGGGGGAAGRILLRSVEPAQVPGVVSPEEGTKTLLM